MTWVCCLHKQLAGVQFWLLLGKEGSIWYLKWPEGASFCIRSTHQILSQPCSINFQVNTSGIILHCFPSLRLYLEAQSKVFI